MATLKSGSLRDLGAVYSTEHGRLCPGCGKPVASCSCKQDAAAKVPANTPVRVGRETKGRAGKGVTVVSGLPLSGDALATLAAELKKRCGSGGTVREGLIEIQGEHRDTLVAELLKRGYQAKRSGG